MFSMIRVAFAAFAGVALAACASSTALEPQNLPLSPRAARVYILRPPTLVGAALLGEVKIDGTEVGSITVNSYLFVDRPPGRYKIHAAITNVMEHEVEVQAGRTYYFAINFKQSYASGGGITIPIEGSNVGRPLTQPGWWDSTWLAEVDANTATTMMARMKPPK